MRRLVILAAGVASMLACVEPFEGSRLEMTLVGAPALQRGVTTDPADNPQRHYEMWASLGRQDATTGELTSDTVVRLMENGFTVQHVVGRLWREPLPTPDADKAEYLHFDPCFIDRNTGELLFYTPTQLEAKRVEMGWTDTSAEYLARARVQARALALASNSLLAFTSYASRVDLPTITATTDTERLAQCQAFWAGDDCPDEACRVDRARYYVGDSEEMSRPLNGAFYGLLGEGSEVQDPHSKAPYGGIEVITPYNLSDLTGLFITEEADVLDATGNLVVDATARGPAITWGTARTNMRGVLRIEMRNEEKTVYGTATVFYSFGTDLAEF
jgi:hypothetical protein